MNVIIENGNGNGNKAKVDNNNRLQTASVIRTASEEASRNGDSFNVNTGLMTLTTANESGVLYLKNTGDKDIRLTTIGFMFDTSTGGSGRTFIEIVKNPEDGTVISDKINCEIIENKNVGSSKELEGDAFKGGEGKTFTNGKPFYYSLVVSNPAIYVINTGDIIIPKGSAIGCNITPPSGNTSMEMLVFCAIAKNSKEE